MGLLGDIFGGIGSAVSGAFDVGAQFIGGLGREFGIGAGGQGRGAGVLAPEFQPVSTTASRIGGIVGQQAIRLGERLVGSTVGIPEGSSDAGDIFAKFPLPPRGRGLGVLDPTRLPAGAGANVRADNGRGIFDLGAAGRAAAGGVENLQTAGVGTFLGSVLAGETVGLGLGKAAKFIGGLFEGGAGVSRQALPGGLAIGDLPLGGALFRPRMGGLTPARVVVVPNPLTGEPIFFGHLGRPLLFSRDLAAHKKVNRLARKAASRRGR